MKSLKNILHSKIHALDGFMGQVSDVYLDTHLWAVRYLVDKTGGFLAQRQILLSPSSVKKVESKKKLVHLSLTLAQIDSSPAVDMDLPVSLQLEKKLARHFDWPNYWAPIGVRPPETSLDVSEEIVEKSFEDSFEDKEKGYNPNLYNLNSILGLKYMEKEETLGLVTDVYYDGIHWDVKGLQLTLHQNSLYDKTILIKNSEIKEFILPDEKILLSIDHNELAEKDDLRGMDLTAMLNS